MPDQYLLTSTFLRFQEFYESPKFRDRGFCLEEFQDWYATTRRKGRFSYYTDWKGFNFPSYVVEGFTPEKFGVISRKESWVLDQLRDVEGRFYVIGTFDDRTTSHEIVHGLFYLNPEYADRVATLVGAHKFEAFKQELRTMGYCDDVLVDEINAYLTSRPT